MAVNNIFSGFPGVFRGELFDKLLDHSDFRIERIVLNSSSSDEAQWLRRKRAQWLMLVQGFVVLESDNERAIEVKAGDYLLLEANSKHRLRWKCPDDETILLSVQF